MLRNPGPARTARVIDPVITALGVTLATAAAAVAHWHGPRAAAAPLLVTAAVWLALLGVRRTAAAVFYPVLNYHGGIEPWAMCDSRTAPAWTVVLRNSGLAPAHITATRYRIRTSERTWEISGEDFGGLHAACHAAGLTDEFAEVVRFTSGGVIPPGEQMVVFRGRKPAVAAVDAVDIVIDYRGPFGRYRKNVYCLTGGASRLPDEPRTTPAPGDQS